MPCRLCKTRLIFFQSELNQCAVSGGQAQQTALDNERFAEQKLQQAAEHCAELEGDLQHETGLRQEAQQRFKDTEAELELCHTQYTSLVAQSTQANQAGTQQQTQLQDKDAELQTLKDKYQQYADEASNLKQEVIDTGRKLTQAQNDHELDLVREKQLAEAQLADLQAGRDGDREAHDAKVSQLENQIKDLAVPWFQSTDPAVGKLELLVKQLQDDLESCGRRSAADLVELQLELKSARQKAKAESKQQGFLLKQARRDKEDAEAKLQSVWPCIKCGRLEEALLAAKKEKAAVEVTARKHLQQGFDAQLNQVVSALKVEVKKAKAEGERQARLLADADQVRKHAEMQLAGKRSKMKDMKQALQQAESAKTEAFNNEQLLKLAKSKLNESEAARTALQGELESLEKDLQSVRQGTSISKVEAVSKWSKLKKSVKPTRANFVAADAFVEVCYLIAQMNSLISNG